MLRRTLLTATFAVVLAAAAYAQGLTSGGGLSTGAGILWAQVKIWMGSPIYVTDLPYGAKCDDVTDDTSAINAAFAAFRTAISNGANGGKIAFPAGKTCLVSGNGVNATSLDAYPAYPNIIVDGNGATIDGRVDAAAVFDLLGNTAITVRDLWVWGNVSTGAHPTIGIQIGRITTISASSNILDNVRVTGQFTVAAFANNASESMTAINLKAYNNSATATSYGGIFDGSNRTHFTSKFVTVTTPQDTVGSLEGVTCVNCDFRANGAGRSLEITGGTYSPTFVSGYVLDQASLAPIVLDLGVGAIWDPHLDLHGENTTIPTNILVRGTGAKTLNGLYFHDNYDFATNSLIALDTGLTSLTIDNPDIAVQAMYTGSATVFDNPANYTLVGGKVFVPAVAQWPSWPKSAKGTQVSFGTDVSGLGQLRLPLVIPSSGTMGNNGALTTTTAVPFAYPRAYVYLPSGAIATGSTAGWYYAVFSSTTAATVYNNVYTPGAGTTPTIPTSPTPFVTTGPGAYTQSVSQIGAFVYQVPANMLGPTGTLRVKASFACDSSANSKVGTFYFGGSTLGSVVGMGTSGVVSAGAAFDLINESSTGVQTLAGANGTFITGTSTGAMPNLAIDTTANQNLLIDLQVANAADDIVLVGATAEIISGASQ